MKAVLYLYVILISSKLSQEIKKREKIIIDAARKIELERNGSPRH